MVVARRLGAGWEGSASKGFGAENSFGDVSERVVTDFGCGCGALGVAAALLGAEQVIGIDIDAQSLEIAAENAVDLEVLLLS
ncbi:hypothetical protein ACFX13_018106 [Malus domestica]